jgi:hypothetical protein
LRVADADWVVEAAIATSVQAGGVCPRTWNARRALVLEDALGNARSDQAIAVA